MKTPRSAILVVAASLLLLGACQFDRAVTGPMRDEPVSIDSGSAERANVELDMGAGEMKLGGGGSKLLEGRFQYNVDAWKPIVRNTVNGSNATVTIKQPEHVSLGGNTHYLWDLQLSDRMLFDLALNFGAGEAHLDLGSVHLRDLQVHMGAGEVHLDLRGEPIRDYDVKIEGGVGQANIQLPPQVGIWASAHGGIGSITVNGLERHGDHWENDLYDKAKVNIRVEVNGGVGEIRITA
ncbi:MAG TPA: toast rack family protein [Bryobacteraceae bacterium]|jgi:hypothetical protein